MSLTASLTKMSGATSRPTAGDAVNLGDRGRIAPDQRAHLLLVDWQSGRMPRLIATFVAGEAVFAAENPLRLTA